MGINMKAEPVQTYELCISLHQLVNTVEYMRCHDISFQNLSLVNNRIPLHVNYEIFN